MRLLLNLIWLVFGGLVMAFGYAVVALVMFVLAGWWLAIGHLITGVLMCLTIIGIPLGLANFKLIPVSLKPFGRDIIDTDQARRLGIQPAVAMPKDPSSR